MNLKLGACPHLSRELFIIQSYQKGKEDMIKHMMGKVAQKPCYGEVYDCYT